MRKHSNQIKHKLPPLTVYLDQLYEIEAIYKEENIPITITVTDNKNKT